MDTFDTLQDCMECDLLVSFFDLTQFSQYTNNKSNQEIFQFLSDYYEFAGDLIEGSGGRIVKFIGDSGLMIFSETNVDSGVLALKELKDQGDLWLSERGSPCRNKVKVHFGPVFCGPVGTRSRKQFDVFGSTVGTAAVLGPHQFVITPQVFRKLDAGTRKIFKKHTPPVTYIPVKEHH
jgi:class 3 adenylate cyclase